MISRPSLKQHNSTTLADTPVYCIHGVSMSTSCHETEEIVASNETQVLLSFAKHEVLQGLHFFHTQLTSLFQISLLRMHEFGNPFDSCRKTLVFIKICHCMQEIESLEQSQTMGRSLVVSSSVAKITIDQIIAPVKLFKCLPLLGPHIEDPQRPSSFIKSPSLFDTERVLNNSPGLI